MNREQTKISVKNQPTKTLIFKSGHEMVATNFQAVLDSPEK